MSSFDESENYKLLTEVVEETLKEAGLSEQLTMEDRKWLMAKTLVTLAPDLTAQEDLNFQNRRFLSHYSGHLQSLLGSRNTVIPIKINDDESILVAAEELQILSGDDEKRDGKMPVFEPNMFQDRDFESEKKRGAAMSKEELESRIQEIVAQRNFDTPIVAEKNEIKSFI